MAVFEGESVSMPVAVAACVAMAVFYVLILYAPTVILRLPKASSFTEFMIRRFICAAISTVASLVFTAFLLPIDPRHRYGHNLHFYYDVWSKSKSSQPFFYWLDIGDGKDVNLEKHPRSVLQKQCISIIKVNCSCMISV